MFSWNVAVPEDTQVDIIGSGVSLIRREWLTSDELKNLYKDAPTTSMDDLILSCLFSRKDLSRWVIEHPQGALQAKEKEKSDSYVYDTYKDNDQAQVEYVNSHFKRG